MNKPAVDRTPLGKTGILVSNIALGCGNWGREISEEQSYRMMDYAIEKGITLFDTGEVYGGGESYEGRKALYGTTDVREASLEKGSSERIIGTWMQKHNCRDRVTLMTKLNTGATGDNIHRSFAGSRDRLQTEFVDIYLLHNPDTNVPVNETVQALSSLVESNQVGAIGCANHSATQLQNALEASQSLGCRKYGVVQTPYSLAWPDSEQALLPLCKQEGIGVTSYSPLGAGFLSGKYSRDREFPAGSRYNIVPGHADIYFTDHNFGLLEKLKSKAAALAEPQVKLAMAWAMTHPSVTTVIVGARDISQIDNAIKAQADGMSLEQRAELSSWTTQRYED